MISLGLADKTGLAHPGYDMTAAPPPQRGYRAPRAPVKPTAITASLVWDAPQLEECHLELHAEVELADGGSVHYSSGKPAQSIFWKHPMAGDYSIAVRPSEDSPVDLDAVSFCATLTGENEKPFEVSGCMKQGEVVCFTFTVAESGAICSLSQQEESDAVSSSYSTRAPSEAEE